MNPSKYQLSLKSSIFHFLFNKRNLFYILVGLLFLYIVIPQIGKFRSSLGLVTHVNFGWLFAAFIFSMLTYTMSALSYYALAKHPIKFRRTVLNQLASMFANHLLPSGIGSLGVSYQYLRKHDHSKNEALAVVYLNNLLGFIGYVLILSYIVFFTNTSINLHLNGHFNYVIALVVSLVVVAIVIIISKFERLRKSIADSIKQIHLGIYMYRKHKKRLLVSLLSIMALTFLYAISLSCCVLAVGYHISLSQALVVLAFGVIGKSVTPTPGGIIGAEAAIFAGLVSYGATAGESLIIIVIYRLVTYWIPFGIGAISFPIVKRRNYI